MKMRVIGAVFAKGSGKIDGEQIDWDSTKICLEVNFTQAQLKAGAFGKNAQLFNFQDSESGKRAISALSVQLPADLDVELSITAKGAEIVSINKLK